MRTDRLVELEAFFPDIEPELPRCPTPVIENKIRDAIIDACERASIWRWEHPEILVIEGQQDYDLLTPTSDTLIHSILALNLNGRPIDSCDSIYSHDDYMNPGRGFSVADRGQIHLSAKPNRSSTPYRALVAPVVPALPVDPGVLNDGIPDTISYLDFGPANGIVRATYNTVNTNLDVADEATILVDMTDWDDSGFGSNSYVRLRAWNGASSSAAYEVYLNSRFHAEATTLNLDRMTNAMIATAVADGRPYILLNWSYNQKWTIMSGFMASPDDIPKYVTVTGSETSASTPTNFFANYSGTPLYNIRQSWNASGSTFASQVGPVGDFRFTTLQGLSIGDNVAISGTGNSDSNSMPNPVIQIESNGQTIEYDVVWDVDLFWSGDNPSPLASTMSSDINIRTLFMLLKQAVPDGERGTLVFRQKISIDFFPNISLVPDEMLALIAAVEVTQDDIDAYNAAVAVYGPAAIAYSAWVAAENRQFKGLEPLVSIKPSRTTLEVSEVLLRDYYHLIVSGTLARAMLMLNRPWSNPEMGKEMEKQYEYALAKAKQGIDRGFKTGTQRIKPRRFVG